MTELLFELPFKVDIGKRKRRWVHLMPSLNKIMRSHFGVWMTTKEKIKELVDAQLESSPKFDRVILEYNRYATRLLDPIDNLGSSFKFIGDVLTECGVWTDDDANVITKSIPMQTKVSRLADERIVVKVTGWYHGQGKHQVEKAPPGKEA